MQARRGEAQDPCGRDAQGGGRAGDTQGIGVVATRIRRVYGREPWHAAQLGAGTTRAARAGARITIGGIEATRCGTRRSQGCVPRHKSERSLFYGQSAREEGGVGEAIEGLPSLARRY